MIRDCDPWIAGKAGPGELRLHVPLVPNPTISQAERVREALRYTPCVFAVHSLVRLDQEPQDDIHIQSTIEKSQRGFDCLA